MDRRKVRRAKGERWVKYYPPVDQSKYKNRLSCRKQNPVRPRGGGPLGPIPPRSCASAVKTLCPPVRPIAGRLPHGDMITFMAFSLPALPNTP